MSHQRTCKDPMDMAQKLAEEIVALLGQQQQQQSEGAGMQQAEESREVDGAQQPVREPGVDRHGFRAEDYLSTARTGSEAKHKFRVSKTKNS